MSASKIFPLCLRAWEARDLSACKPLGLDVGTWMACLTVLAGVTIFIVRKVGSWTQGRRAQKYYISRSVGRSRFRNLCRAVKPLMEENSRIFLRFGPNSGEGDGSPKLIRFDLGVWYQLRHDIVQNNTKIKLLINTNFSSVPAEHCDLFARWVDHIDAFRSHVADQSADYRNFQFPDDVVRVVRRYA